MEHVTSSDGTAITYEGVGSGPPLVLVHGTSVERFSFRFVEPLLATVLGDGWNVVTRDKSLSAQFEHTLAVTADGCEVLTIPSAA